MISLGCAKNLVDSEMLVGGLKQENYEMVKSSDDADILIVNTCGFLDTAREESVEVILDASELRKSGQVQQLLVMGCFSERYSPELRKEIPEVDEFFGTQDHGEVLGYLTGKPHAKADPDYFRSLLTPGHYAYLKIAEGCDNGCSFCSIPLMRGLQKSQPVEWNLQEARRLAANGVKELLVIAQDSTSYGWDLTPRSSLHELMDELNKVEGLEWIRLHYAFPTGFPMDVLDVINEEPKVCNYIDIPLQHISTKLLKSMRRGTTYEKTNALLKSFREKVPQMTIRTTLIVGYPGETQEDFELLRDWVKEMRFERLGCFTYSHEENTHAYNLEDDVPEDVKMERANEIMSIQSQISWELNQQKIGKEFKVVVDRKEGNYFVGRTEFDSPDVDNEVLIDASQHYLKTGEFYTVKITEAEDFDLYAEPV